MKNTQRDAIYKTEEFEDLTLYANESFDTQDVDLFEFSREESSPLTRLKSIILSLDWEINDDILQELADELENLQSMWQDDNIAEVYLQGLDKIGSYIRSKGAYAHPNSIKLLLTFFYNFEKIISSQDISGDQITQLLKADVRKFKILQYQINQSEITAPGGSDELPEDAGQPELPSVPESADPAKHLKAAILSLDWEVTDESLIQFNVRLSEYSEKVGGNKAAMVLIQGLQALGDYIGEERANAHPESFLLLHSFNEALEQVARADERRLTEEEIRDILVDSINRLNTLKLMIAAPSEASVSESHLAETAGVIGLAAMMGGDSGHLPEFPQEEPAAIEMPATAQREESIAPLTLEAELDTLFGRDAKPAMETADIQYPDEILPADAIQPVDDELADDFLEAQLNSTRDLRPALSDTDEMSGFNEEAEPLDLPAQSDLAEQLDFLFADTNHENEERKAAFVASDAPAADFDFDETDQTVAALSDAVPPANMGLNTSLAGAEVENDQQYIEIQSKLDDFFALASEESEEPESPPGDVEAIEQALFSADESGIEPALADSEEGQGFTEPMAAVDATPMEEIVEKLDFFFGTEAEEAAAVDLNKSDASPIDALRQPDETFSASADTLEASLARIFDDEQEEPAMPPALDQFELPEELKEVDRSGLAAPVIAANDLEGALDLFFETAEGEGIEPAADTLTEALEATIAEGQASADMGSKIQFAALGALLPMIVRAPAHERIAESAELFAALKKSGLASEQQALLQLLESIVTMLVRLPTKDAAATEKLVNYLYEHLLQEHCSPETLAEAVGRFTSWLQQAGAIMPLIPTVSGGPEQEPQFAYTAKELYFELSEMRTHIREEFKKLRHELHHHQA